ncbi:MAG: hypothetical protein ACFCBW_08900 [Candidatus Competibacterales bacterium]
MGNELKAGEVYFKFSYIGGSYRLPQVETLVYIGKNINGDEQAQGKELYYFQGVESFVRCSRFENLSKDADYASDVVGLEAPELTRLILDPQGLIEALYRHLQGVDS